MESRSPLAACQAARSHAVRGDAPDQATGLEAAEIADPKAREGRKAVGLVEADPGPSSQGPHQRARKAVSSTFQGPDPLQHFGVAGDTLHVRGLAKVIYLGLGNAR